MCFLIYIIFAAGARKRQKYVEEASAALSKVEYEVSSLKRELEGVNSHLERLEKVRMKK